MASGMGSGMGSGSDKSGKTGRLVSFVIGFPAEPGEPGKVVTNSVDLPRYGLLSTNRLTVKVSIDGEEVGFKLAESLDEIIYMKGVGLLNMEKPVMKSVKKIAKEDVDGSIYIGVGSAPLLVDFPRRHGPIPPIRGWTTWNGLPAPIRGWTTWHGLPAKLKNRIHGLHLASLKVDHVGIDFNMGLAWAYANRENNREFMAMLYSNVSIHFIVTDFDFGEVIGFIDSLSYPLRHSLLFNNNLNIYLACTTENLEPSQLSGTYEWLDFCEDVNRGLQLKKFTNIRVPWIYHADGNDMVLHVEWEQRVLRLPNFNQEWNLERQVMKHALQYAPLR